MRRLPHPRCLSTPSAIRLLPDSGEQNQQLVFTVPALSAEQCDRLCEFTRERVSGKLIDTVDSCPEWQARAFPTPLPLSPLCVKNGSTVPLTRLLTIRGGGSPPR